MFIFELCINVFILYIIIGKQDWVNKIKIIIILDNKIEDILGDE